MTLSCHTSERALVTLPTRFLHDVELLPSSSVGLDLVTFGQSGVLVKKKTGEEVHIWIGMNLCGSLQEN